jgi:hypothetical protein
MAFGRPISSTTKKIDLFDQYLFDSSYFCLKIAITMVNMAMVGAISTKLEKEATRRQSTAIKIYGLLAIMVLLRLVPRGIVGWLMRWAKLSVAMVGWMRNNFVFVFYV